jgi:hypothetical protein
LHYKPIAGNTEKPANLAVHGHQTSAAVPHGQLESGVPAFAGAYLQK